MLLRTARAFARVAPSRSFTKMASESATPMEDTIRAKIFAAFQPAHLEIHNDSASHAHHAAMRGRATPESHFRLVIVSDAFCQYASQPARHRAVYKLLAAELAREGGLHALQQRTLTVGEAQKLGVEVMGEKEKGEKGEGNREGEGEGEGKEL